MTAGGGKQGSNRREHRLSSTQHPSHPYVLITIVTGFLLALKAVVGAAEVGEPVGAVVVGEEVGADVGAAVGPEVGGCVGAE
eukprot:1154784-Prorocentrum_minimum.AAC.1